MISDELFLNNLISKKKDNKKSTPHFLLSDKLDLKDYLREKRKLNKHIKSFPNLALSKKIHLDQIKLIQGIVIHFCDLKDFDSVMRSDQNGGTKNNIQIAQAIIKSIISMDAMIILIENGHHASAKAMARQVLEFCILAKFCALVPEQLKYEKWLDDQDVMLGPEILSQLKTPAISQFWKDLSRYCHATVGSGQVNVGQIDDEDLKLGTNSSVNILLTTQIMLFHLVNTVAMTPKLKRYIFNHSMPDKSEIYKKTRDSIKSKLKVVNKNYTTLHTKKIQAEFQKDWRPLLLSPNKKILNELNRKKKKKAEKLADLFMKEIFCFSLLIANNDTRNAIHLTSRNHQTWDEYLLATNLFCKGWDDEENKEYIQIKEEYEIEETGIVGWDIGDKTFQRLYLKGIKQVDKSWIQRRVDYWLSDPKFRYS